MQHSESHGFHLPIIVHSNDNLKYDHLFHFFQLGLQGDDPVLEVVDVVLEGLGLPLLNLQLNFDAVKPRLSLRESRLQLINLMIDGELFKY